MYKPHGTVFDFSGNIRLLINTAATYKKKRNSKNYQKLKTKTQNRTIAHASDTISSLANLIFLIVLATGILTVNTSERLVGATFTSVAATSSPLFDVRGLFLSARSFERKETSFFQKTIDFQAFSEMYLMAWVLAVLLIEQCPLLIDDLPCLLAPNTLRLLVRTKIRFHFGDLNFKYLEVKDFFKKLPIVLNPKSPIIALNLFIYYYYILKRKLQIIFFKKKINNNNNYNSSIEFVSFSLHKS